MSIDDGSAPRGDTLPRIVGDTSALPEVAHGPAGAVWRLEPAERGLDANVVSLPPGDEIAAHDGPALDVLIHVIDGAGTLHTADGEIALTPGVLVWLPPRSRRRVVAGTEGVRYLSVHGRKPPLTIRSR